MNVSSYRIIEGRRTRPLAARVTASNGPHGAHDELGSYFARSAEADAESAAAFAQLARELRSWSAPGDLVARCEQARAAELRHVEVFAALAATRGIAVAPPAAKPLPVRPLFDIAIENIVEGVVRETYGAAIAKYRAQRAVDPDVRSAMQLVAEDECAHAQLALDIAVWLQARVDPFETALVEDSMRHAIIELSRELGAQPEHGLPAAGVPGRCEAMTIWTGLRHRVWTGMSECVWRAAA